MCRMLHFLNESFYALLSVIFAEAMSVILFLGCVLVFGIWYLVLGTVTFFFVSCKFETSLQIGIEIEILVLNYVQ